MTAAAHLAPRFASALSTSPHTAAAIDEACARAAEELGAQPDLAFVFFSVHHSPEAETIASELMRRLSPGCLLGCSGESIVGNEREIEGEPALSLWLAALPGVSLRALDLEFANTSDGGALLGWPEDLSGAWPAGSALILLADPFSFPADWLLQRLNEDQPKVPVLGGMASGAASPGRNRLIVGNKVAAGGAVGVLVHGAINLRAVVSQGCRPIGRHYVVTKAEQNVIAELSGKPPLLQLQEVFDELTPRDQQLVQKGLHLGLVINEYQDRFDRGDFLVRNCLGADRETGALAIGDYLRPGQTVQFHVRDAQTADEDLRELLRQAGGGAGALLFTCNGRGTRLFDGPNHDAGVVREVLGPIPVAGFFAQGEIGPIGGKNFLHGFTASTAVFQPLVRTSS
ncbi:MAG TPA: FIST N-terminal domain-containing protein [Pirellulales bacterium]|jgi:small ligand-binding sensory domain FIST|nr:FIST N-terminal domain-containing protein [Pirellulales bacterium]